MSLEAFVILFYRRNFHHFLAVSFITVRRLISKTFSTSSDNPLTSLQGLLAHHHHHHRLQHQLLLLPRRDTGTELKWWPSSIFIGWYFFYPNRFQKIHSKLCRKKIRETRCFSFFSFQVIQSWFSKEVRFHQKMKKNLFENKNPFSRLDFSTQLFFSVSFFLLLVLTLASQAFQLPA